MTIKLLFLEQFCWLAFHVWILGKRSSEERLSSEVPPLMSIPIVSLFFFSILIKQRNSVSESLLCFTLVSSSVLWHLGRSSVLPVTAVALHLYCLFPLYLCWDMCVTSFHCETIISLSLTLILLQLYFYLSGSEFLVLSRWTTAISPLKVLPLRGTQAQNCSGTQMWKLRVWRSFENSPSLFCCLRKVSHLSALKTSIFLLSL